MKSYENIRCNRLFIGRLKHRTVCKLLHSCYMYKLVNSTVAVCGVVIMLWIHSLQLIGARRGTYVCFASMWHVKLINDHIPGYKMSNIVVSSLHQLCWEYFVENSRFISIIFRDCQRKYLDQFIHNYVKMTKIILNCQLIYRIKFHKNRKKMQLHENSTIHVQYIYIYVPYY